MKKFDIWAEGFMISGMHSPEGAMLIAENVEAKTFQDACKLAAQSGKIVDFTEDPPRSWGCRLYDNEKDARKSFG